MKKWRLISSKDVSPSKWMPISEQKVELPNGSVLDDYYVIGPWNVAMVMPITTNNEVVFVRQYKHGVGELALEFPAGYMDMGETPAQTARRELSEETGFVIEELLDIGEIPAVPTKAKITNYSFIAPNVSKMGKTSLDANEDIELVYVPMEELSEFIASDENLIPAETLAHIQMAQVKHPELFG